MVDWIYKCGNDWKYCKDGFCSQYNDLKERHKRPAVEMANEWKERTGKDWKPGAIRKKFERLTVTECHDYEKPDYETCAVSDLERIVKSNKKFGTIYADPPWPYSNQATRASTSNHYNTMSIENISALPIKDLTAENCHLHMWTTNAFIFETPKIIESWGFVYKSIFVWVKPQMGIGNYWRVSHEFLITAIKHGSSTFLDKSQMSWLQADRLKHSAKPEKVAESIEKTSPGPYLELFGRRTRKNWTVWGNEIERDLFNENCFN